MKRVKWYLAVLVVLAIATMIGLAGAEQYSDSGIVLDAPSSYTLGSGGNYQFQVSSERNLGSNVAGKNWKIELTDARGNPLQTWDRENCNGDDITLNGNGYTYSNDIPLVVGQVYTVRLELEVQGYSPVEDEVRFIVLNAPDAGQPSLTIEFGSILNGEPLYLENQSSLRYVTTNELYAVRVTPDDSITAVKVLNRDHWEYMWAGDSYEREWRWEAGKWALMAYGTTDEINPEDPDFDWDDVEWDVQSNVISLRMQATHGQLTQPALTLDKKEGAEDYTYDRGDTITAHMEKVEGGVWYYLRIFDTDENGNSTWNPVYETDLWDDSGEGTLVIPCPTYHLPAGNYVVWAGVSGIDYRGNGTEEIPFTLNAGSAPAGAVLIIDPMSVETNEEAQIYAYAPGADEYKVEITKAGDPDWHDSFWPDREGDYCTWLWCDAFRGDYTFTLYTREGGDEDEWEAAAEPVTLAVTAEGNLGELTISGVPGTLTAGESRAIQGSFTKVDNAQWYMIDLVRLGMDGEGDVSIWNDFRSVDGNGNVNTGLLFDNTDTARRFDQPGVYQFQITAGNRNWNGTHGTWTINVSERDLELDVVNGTELYIEPGSGDTWPAYYQYSGSSYYKFYIRQIPEYADGIWMGYGAADAEAPSSSWFMPMSRLRRDSGGSFTVSLPDVPEGYDGDTISDAVFVRLNNEQPWQKAAFIYDLTKTDSTTATVTNTTEPVLNEDYTITWAPVEGADAYIIYWEIPNGGDCPGFLVSGEKTSLKLGDLWEIFGDVEELTRYAGDYRVWFTAYANGTTIDSGARTFTVAAMQAEEGQEFRLATDKTETDSDGNILLDVHDCIRFTIIADEYTRNNMTEFQIVNGETMEGVNMWQLGRYGYTYSWWTPNRDKYEDYIYTAYARAMVDDEWIYTDPVKIHVTTGSAISGTLTYTDANGTAFDNENPVSVAKDGFLVVRVNNIAGVEYYGCRIVNGEWFEDSRWVTTEGGNYTYVRMPVFDCEPGEAYEAEVYAVKIGAPTLYAESKIKFTVTDKTNATDPIILDMTDTFATDERIRIYARYENPGDRLDEGSAWIHVTVYDAEEYYDKGAENAFRIWDGDGDGFYFWTDGLRINEPGDYVVEAAITQVDENWNSYILDDTRTTRTIHVSAVTDGEGNPLTLAEPIVAADEFAYTGAVKAITFNELANAERFSCNITRSCTEDMIMNEERTGPGDIMIDTGILGSGFYRIDADAMARGYIPGHTTVWLAVMDKAYAKNGPGYYFSCSAERPEATGNEDGSDGDGEGGEEDETIQPDYIAEVSQSIQFIYYVPGAEEVCLSERKTEWREDDVRGINGRDEPGIEQWHEFDEGGVYEIYGSYKMDGEWSEPVLLCVIEVNSYGSLGEPWVDMPMVVQAGEDVRITFHTDEMIDSYSYWIALEGENQGWIDGSGKDRWELEPGEDSFDFVIPAKKLEANRIYHVYLDTRTQGYVPGHADRTLYVLGEPETDTDVLSISGPGSITFSESFPIEVSAPGADETLIWWETANDFRWTEGGTAKQWFCQDWNPVDDNEEELAACHFYAIAGYGSFLKVSPTITIPFDRTGVGRAPAPAVTILNGGTVGENGVYTGTIHQGELIQVQIDAVTVNEGQEIEGYQVFVTDDDDNWIDFAYSDTPGILYLPTSGWRTGYTYKIRAYARVPGCYRTDSKPILVEISTPEGSSFFVSKDEVQVCEPLAVSIVAPGAERIRFSGGYGDWWGDEGWEGDSWYNTEVRWEISADPDIVIRAQALYPNNDEWTDIGSAHISVTAVGSLTNPEIEIPETVPAGQDLTFTIPEVTDKETGEHAAEWYRIELRRNDGGEWYFDAEPGENTIPGYALYGGGYQIKILALSTGYNAGQWDGRFYVEPTRLEILVDSVVSNTQTLTIQVPLIEGGINYSLRIHRPNEEDIFSADRSYENAVNGVLTFTVPAGTLEDGAYWIDCYVGGESNFYCDNSKAILVRNGQADSNIQIRVDSTRVAINERFEVRVNAPGAKAIRIRIGDEDRCYPGSTAQDEFSEYQEYPMVLYAQACYTENLELPEELYDFNWDTLTWSAPSEAIEMTFYVRGQAGEPNFNAPNTVARGDLLAISDIYPGDNANEAHANITGNSVSNEPEDNGWWMFGEWQSWNERTREICLTTANMSLGTYWLAVDCSGIGYTGNRRWHRIEITEPELEAHDIAFAVQENIMLGDFMPISIYAPGAERVGISIDADQRPEGEESITWCNSDSWAEARWYRWENPDETGPHTVIAYAKFADTEEPVTVSRTVYVIDPDLEEPEIRAASVINNTTAFDIVVPVVPHGEHYSLAIHIAGRDDEESYKFREEKLASEDATETDGEWLLTFTVPAGTLENGAYWIDCHADGERPGFNSSDSHRMILVNNGTADTRINLDVDRTEVPVNVDFRVSVSATGAKAIRVCFGDHSYCYAGSSAEDRFSEYQSATEVLYAQACYTENLVLPEDLSNYDWDSLTWSAPGGITEMHFISYGQAGEPNYNAPDTVVRGDLLKISNIDLGDGATEAHANIDRNPPDQQEDLVYQYGWHGWDAESRTIYLSTSMLEPGTYWIAVDNSGPGRENSRRWHRFIVTARQGQQENSIILSAAAKVQTGCTVPVSVYAPGATRVAYRIGEDSGSYREMDGDIIYDVNDLRFNQAGTYTINAYAWFGGANDPVTTSATVNVCNPLMFDLSGLPGYFSIGQKNASLTMRLPANADGMNIVIRDDWDGGWETLYEDDDLTADTTYTIPTASLAEGHWIEIVYYAYSEELGDTFGTTCILVTAPAGNGATLALEEGELANIQTNQDIAFRVTPAQGHTLTAIRFYDGHGYWNGGDEINQDNTDWFDEDGVTLWCRYNHNDNPEQVLSVFAEVRVDGSEKWQTTNSLQFTVKTPHGPTGSYDFTDLTPITVEQGKPVTVTFTPSENANEYWADVFTEDGWSFNPHTISNGRTVKISTMNITAGTYYIVGRAGNSEPGWRWSDSDSRRTLNIVESTTEMREPTFTTPASLETIEEEAFAGIAAEVVQISGDVGRIGDRAFAYSSVKQVIILNGATEVSDSAFEGCGEIIVFSERDTNVYQWAERNGYEFHPIPTE